MVEMKSDEYYYDKAERDLSVEERDRLTERRIYFSCDLEKKVEEAILIIVAEALNSDPLMVKNKDYGMIVETLQRAVEAGADKAAKKMVDVLSTSIWCWKWQ